MRECPPAPTLRILCGLALIGALIVLPACDKQPADQGKSTPPPTEQPAAQDKPPVPKIKEWVVNIVDDDSFTQGGITYSIALNLNAANPSQDAAGTYTGSATANTTTEGTTGGHQLSTSAIAKSSTLEFTLTGTDAADDPLAPLTPEDQVYSGVGSIVMAASGDGSIDGAGGGFSNTSGQNLNFAVQGSKVTMHVTISGHTYTFNGTLQPVEE